MSMLHRRLRTAEGETHAAARRVRGAGRRFGTVLRRRAATPGALLAAFAAALAIGRAGGRGAAVRRARGGLAQALRMAALGALALMRARSGRGA